MDYTASCTRAKDLLDSNPDGNADLRTAVEDLMLVSCECICNGNGVRIVTHAIALGLP